MGVPRAPARSLFEFGTMFCFVVVVVVVVVFVFLLLYVHGIQLGTCRDGQVPNHTCTSDEKAIKTVRACHNLVSEEVMLQLTNSYSYK